MCQSVIQDSRTTNLCESSVFSLPRNALALSIMSANVVGSLCLQWISSLPSMHSLGSNLSAEVVHKNHSINVLPHSWRCTHADLDTKAIAERK